MRRRTDMLTTGNVAEVCRVSTRTVAKWFDEGLLKGYLVGKDRRVTEPSLREFMTQRGMPVARLDEWLPEDGKKVQAKETQTILLSEFIAQLNAILKECGNFHVLAMIPYSVTLRDPEIEVQDAKEQVVIAGAGEERAL